MVVIVVVVVVGKSAGTRFRMCKSGCHGIYLINLTGGARMRSPETSSSEMVFEW